MESMQNIFITVSHGKFRETMCDTKAVGVPCCQENLPVTEKGNCKYIN